MKEKIINIAESLKLNYIGEDVAIKELFILSTVNKRIFLVEFRNYKEEKEWRDCFIAENETHTAQQIKEKYKNNFTSYQIVDNYAC